METLKKTLYWLSIMVMVAFAVLAWIFIGWQIGVAGLIAIPVFMGAYALSDKIAISRRDRYHRSEWGVFCKKMAWAWSTALIVYAVAYILIVYCGGDPMEVMPK